MNDLVNLLPGPVGVSQSVRTAFAQAPISHRSVAFNQMLNNTKYSLCSLVETEHVEIVLGSGTLANDMIAAQLSLNTKPGLILSNGEFGERLIDQARQFRLDFSVFSLSWGEIFKRAEIEQILLRNPEIGWVWAVHCETSTGVLNELAMLKEICREYELRLCLDCISSLGTVPVNLRGIYLASGVSGKGFASFPGLCLVFFNHSISPASGLLPKYLDLGLYSNCKGVPFTHSSNLVRALQVALQEVEVPDRFKHITTLSRWLRLRLRKCGFSILAPEKHSSPAVLTIPLSRGISSEEVGTHLENMGILIGFRSGYLLERNWIQICLMGGCSMKDVMPLPNLLIHATKRQRQPPKKLQQSRLKSRMDT